MIDKDETDRDAMIRALVVAARVERSQTMLRMLRRLLGWVASQIRRPSGRPRGASPTCVPTCVKTAAGHP